MIASGLLVEHIGISLQRAAIGFALAVVVAIPLGFLMGRYSPFERATDLLVQTLRNTSQFALMPVFILILGIGEASKIAITFYAAVFFLLINTIVGVKSVDPAAAQGGALDGHLRPRPVPQGDLPLVDPLDRRRRPARGEVLALLGDRGRDARGAVGHRLPDPARPADARDRRHVRRHHHADHRRPAGELRPRLDRAPGDALARQRRGRRRSCPTRPNPDGDAVPDRRDRGPGGALDRPQRRGATSGNQRK